MALTASFASVAAGFPSIPAVLWRGVHQRQAARGEDGDCLDHQEAGRRADVLREKGAHKLTTFAEERVVTTLLRKSTSRYSAPSFLPLRAKVMFFPTGV